MAYLQALPDPFGSYVKGEQAGQESTIREGMAARQFRAADLSPEVQKWYLPLVQREAQTRASTGELGLNEGLLRNAAQVSALGPGGADYFGRTVGNIYGFQPDFNGSDPRTAFLRANLGAGNIQSSYADPSVGWGTQGGGFARPSIEGNGQPPSELEQLRQQLETEQLRAQLSRLRNPQAGGMFGDAFGFLDKNGTGAANMNVGQPGVPKIQPPGGIDLHEPNNQVGGVTPPKPGATTFANPYGAQPKQPAANPDHYGSGGIFTP